MYAGELPVLGIVENRLTSDTLISLDHQHTIQVASYGHVIHEGVENLTNSRPY